MRMVPICLTTLLAVSSAGLLTAALSDPEDLLLTISEEEQADGKIPLEVAVAQAELVDIYIEENGQAWEVYYDQITGLMWIQHAGQPKESLLNSRKLDGTVGTRAGDQPRVLLTPIIFTYSNTSGSTYVFRRSLDEIVYGGLYDLNTTYWHVTHPALVPHDVDRIAASAQSGLDSYCDSEYFGWYRDVESQDWKYAEYTNCGTSVITGETYYQIREGVHVDGVDFEDDQGLETGC
jgi:hypothetical protein